jgi:hypothetical protein
MRSKEPKKSRNESNAIRVSPLLLFKLHSPQAKTPGSSYR